MATGNTAIQMYVLGKDPPASDTEVSIKLKHLEDFVTMKNAVKEAHKSSNPPGDNDDFHEDFSELLQDIAVKTGGRSVGKYTTIKSITSGVLNIGLLELTVVALKELIQAGKEVEPLYALLFAIYISMMIIQVAGLMGLSYLALTDFKTALLSKGERKYNFLNNSIAMAASVLLILGTIASALKTDKNAVSIDKFIETLKNQNVTVDFGKLLNQ